jgi:hypothetical protein
MRVRFMAIMAALVAAVAVPGVAQAAPPLEHAFEEVKDSGSHTECGFTIEFEDTRSAHVMRREVSGSDGQVFLAQDNTTQYKTVYTNPVTGAFMVERGVDTFKQVTARHVAGNTWEITIHHVGHSVIEDSEGNIVATDSGRITFRILIDTLGDSDPGFDVLKEEMTGEHGRHSDFCAIATDLIG